MRVALLVGWPRYSMGLGFLTARYPTLLLLLYISLWAGKGITPEDQQTPVALQIPAITSCRSCFPGCQQTPPRVPLVEFRHTQGDDSSLQVQRAAPQHCRENPLLLPGVKQLNQLDLGISKMRRMR